MKWLKKLLHVLLDIIWPRGVMCLLCDELSEGNLLCRECAEELSNLRLQGEQGSCRSAYPYKGNARKLVIALKYNNLGDAATVLAEAMAEEAADMNLPANTVLTWVTMPEKRRKQRGIDHGKRLCEEIGARTGFLVRKLLIRKKDVRTQQGLSRAERRRNLRGVFSCPERVNAPVLLIDDVYTTGATTGACINALRKAGAPAVYLLTATRVQKLSATDE